MFNWFRRQYNKKPDSPSSEEPAEKPANTTETQVDYADWANTAYKNINDRQQNKQASQKEEKIGRKN